TELGEVPIPKGPPTRASTEPVAIQRLRRCVDQADAACAKAALAQVKTVRLEDSADDLNLEAAALNLLHQDKPALAAIQRAIQINGRQTSYLVTEGRIYQRIGNQVAAIKCFLDAEQMQRGAAAPLYYLGMSFFMLGNYNNDNQDYNRAARHFQTALQLDPRYDRAEFMLGIVNAIEFRLDDAKKELAKALQMNPGNAYYHLHYGMVLARLGDLAGGQREIELAEKLNPSYAPTHLHLGDLDAQMGNYPEAREQLESAIRLDPHLSSAYYTLGTVCHHLGLAAKSRDAFQKFQQMKSQQDQNSDPVESSISLAESRSVAKRQ
ncbi:MAG: tetratricopeptide repeat protein, partial [Terriglobia bacterium]